MRSVWEDIADEEAIERWRARKHLRRGSPQVGDTQEARTLPPEKSTVPEEDQQ
jgi:hypothetical protein